MFIQDALPEKTGLVQGNWTGNILVSQSILEHTKEALELLHNFCIVCLVSVMN